MKTSFIVLFGLLAVAIISTEAVAVGKYDGTCYFKDNCKGGSYKSGKLVDAYYCCSMIGGKTFKMHVDIKSCLSCKVSK